MSNVLLVARRDLGAFLTSWLAYIIIAAVLFIDGIFFTAWVMGDTARYSSEVLEDFFYFSSGVLMIASILFTMRSVAEERGSGTLVLLLTSPIKTGEIILGKYTAAMTIMTILTGLTLYMPAMIFVNGRVAIGHIFAGYLGLLLLSSATAAIGIFGSSLFRSQLAAAVIAGVLVVTLLTAWLVSAITDPPFAAVLAHAALFDKHFVPFMEGSIPTTAIVYYATVTGVFLLMSTRVLDGRRWE